MSHYVVVYVRHRLCGCRIDVSRSVEELSMRKPLPLAVTSLTTMTPEQVKAVPTVCDVCTPVRQEALL